MEHQYSVYEPLVRVPLIVRYPPLFPAGDDTSLVQSHDIFPTLLQVANVEWEPRAEHTARSLLNPVETNDTIAISEYLWPAHSVTARVTARYPDLDLSGLLASKRVVQRGMMKLILSQGAPPRLYDLASDPGEMIDRSEERPAEVADLQEHLEAWLGSFEHYTGADEAPAVSSDLSSQDLERLRTLGYVN
jgi:arylsulfatase A-like enzyme